MILNDTEDTIVAIATPLGEGAIAVIRLSGPQAISTVAKHFVSKKPLEKQPSHTVQFGRIVDAQGKIIDEVVCTVFRSPHSYTGEDIVEISCHGGLFVPQQLLDLFVASGARLAKPGEFTRRAFLNGKLDLSQAEAVADLIQSQSARAHKSSIDQLAGKLSKEIQKLRDELLETLRLLELELDFVEEDIEFVDRPAVAQQIENIKEKLEQLIGSFEVGKIYREGVRVALLGEPNVGKSSLLNTLLKQDRAIVTHIPGTTRDFIEESIAIDGILFRLIDTAGLRETDDPVEKEGVKRTQDIAATVDIALLVTDALQGQKGIESILQYFREQTFSHSILVVNKIDLLKEKMQMQIPEKIAIVETSTFTEEGIESLKKKLVSLSVEAEGTIAESSVVVTNRRHRESLVKAREALKRAEDSLQGGNSNEFIAIDLRVALDHLGEIIGAVTSDEILNGIFAKFCIGK